MILALLCQFTAQHVSDVNISIFRSLRLLCVLLCRLYCADLRTWHQHTSSQHNNAQSSRKLLKMDVLTSETCWAVNWHNKASVIKLVYLHSNIKMMHGPIRIRSQLDANYFLVYLFQLLYMFRATMCSSSGELTASSQPADQTATHTEWKIPVSHSYSKFSWWWEHSCPKHVQKLK